MRHPTPKRASANERAIRRGPGGIAPGVFLPAFWRKPGSRPESGGEPRCRPGPALVQTRTPCRRQTRPPGPTRGHLFLHSVGVHPNGHRPVVDGGHRHIRPELAVFHLEPPGPAEVQEGLVQGDGHRRGAALVNPGRRLLMSAYRVNWDTTKGAPPTASKFRFILPAWSAKTRRPQILSASFSAWAWVSSGPMPRRTRKPVPISPRSPRRWRRRPRTPGLPLRA